MSRLCMSEDDDDGTLARSADRVTAREVYDNARVRRAAYVSAENDDFHFITRAGRSESYFQPFSAPSCKNCGL